MHTQLRSLGKSRSALFSLALSAASMLAPPQAHADADDILAGLFDAAAGVPFATTMLGIVRSGVSGPTTPAALDQRLSAVEQLLGQIDARMHQLEGRVDQLQVETVKTQNLARLREYQRLSGAIGLINTELKTHPTDNGRRVVLEASARQLADSIRDTPSFDLWMWTDIDKQTALLRTRFHVTPTFQIYSLAVATWFSTLSTLYGDRPLALVAEAGPALHKHAEFLRVRSGWRDQIQPPLALPEYLNTAVFCRPATMQKFADQNGSCRFGTECLDNIDGKVSQGAEFALNMGQAVPGAPTLCTWDANRRWDFPSEQQLRDAHGETLMSALADALEKIAATGSLADQLVGTFPDWVLSPIYSVSLDQPLQAPLASTIGAVPVIASCSITTGCQLPATKEAYWRLAVSSQVHYVRNEGTSLCLDVKNNKVELGATLAMWTCNGTPTQSWVKQATTPGHWHLTSADSSLCVTVATDPPSPPPGSVSSVPRFVRPQRSLSLEACNSTNPRQEFANVDSTPVPGPR